jgi:DNA-binding transcriptional MerR regulator
MPKESSVEQEHRFISMGGVAAKLGVSTTMVRRYERQGLIPAGRRVDGSQARIWPIEEVELMRERVTERRAQQKGALQPTAA